MSMLPAFALVALGVAFGACARFGAGLAMQRLAGAAFPYATLFVNAIGSLLIGVLFVAVLEARSLPPAMRELVMVGVLGSFTTFSTFSLETLQLFAAGEPGKAGLNVVANLVICILFCWFGLVFGRSLHNL